MHDLHHSHDFDMSKYDFRNNLNAPAELFFENLRDLIGRYEAKIDESHQLVCEIACLNGNEYRVHELGYVNPSLIRFIVFDPTGTRCELLVHVASVQFILRVEEVGSEGRKKRIGFQT